MKEWLETNGIGGFASSTTSGMNTRRYHGLLVAATKPPVGRMVLLSKIEETLVIDGRRVELSCNQYPGVVYPQGQLYLTHFRMHPFPMFVYEVEGVELEKSIFMVQGENTTVMEYRLKGPATQCALELRPLIAFRDYHSLMRANDSINSTLDIRPGIVACTPYQGCPTLYLAHSEGNVEQAGNWYRNFQYAIEQERGLDFQEDLFNPLTLTFDLKSGATVIASTETHNASEAARLRESETHRRSELERSDPFENALVRAADQFIVSRGDQKTVIAGYHWFSDWGRDTMIALPGLTLTTWRYDAARGILLAFAAIIDRGMLPNRFPDAGEMPEYNTIDATLWFFEAVRALAEHTGDYAFVRTRLYAVMQDIVAWHERGTRYGIHLDVDGLLSSTDPTVQLTWMDVKIGDWVVTPRTGKPVEIQALWYNALLIMEGLARRFGDDPTHYLELAARAKSSFNDQFWNESNGCLYDVVNGTTRDASIRPNQIFAVSLFHSMLPEDHAARVVSAVEKNLLTPYGLRSLAPSDPRYIGRYEGDSFNRDRAYHQGTVWPWLIGPFISAYRKVNPEVQIKHWLTELKRYIEETGQIAEVFDGDAPHRPGGCITQAWSVGEILRVIVPVRKPS